MTDSFMFIKRLNESRRITKEFKNKLTGFNSSILLNDKININSHINF